MQIALERIDIGIAPGETLVLKRGDKLRIFTRFEYMGVGSFTLYGAIGHADTLIGWDEKAHREKNINLPRVETFTTFEEHVDIPTNIKPGIYDIYVKIKEVEKAGKPELRDVIEIEEAPKWPLSKLLVLGLSAGGAIYLMRKVRS